MAATPAYMAAHHLRLLLDEMGFGVLVHSSVRGQTEKTENREPDRSSLERMSDEEFSAWLKTQTKETPAKPQQHHHQHHQVHPELQKVVGASLFQKSNESDAVQTKHFYRANLLQISKYIQAFLHLRVL
eukprot:COSAG05_NODE_1192_length_5572_cov_3.202266_2_plen_129_part_00